MAIIRNINLIWNGPGHNPKLTVLWLTAGVTLGVQRERLGDFLDALAPVIGDGTTVAVANEGVEVEDTTGQLVGAWSHSTQYFTEGLEPEQPLPDASMALIRTETGQIIDGRRLRGRMFIPGLTTTAMANGNMAQATYDTMMSASGPLVSGLLGLVVWGRPRAATGNLPSRIGGSAPVIGRSVWTEFAVQRGRRG